MHFHFFFFWDFLFHLNHSECNFFEILSSNHGARTLQGWRVVIDSLQNWPRRRGKLGWIYIYPNIVSEISKRSKFLMSWLLITFTLINKLGTLFIEITIWLFCCGYCYRAFKKPMSFLNSLGWEERECGKLDNFCAQWHIFIPHWSTL